MKRDGLGTFVNLILVWIKTYLVLAMAHVWPLDIPMQNVGATQVILVKIVK